jgi:hypothetical protein
MTRAGHGRAYDHRMTKLGSLVLVAVALGGCPSDDTISIDKLADSLQSAECDFEVRCEAVADVATCKAALPLDSTDELTTIAAVKAGSISYDGKLAKQCVDSFEALACTFVAIENSVSDACQDIFTGTVAIGSACIVSEQCADHGTCQHSDPNCDTTTACCTGACVAGTVKTPIGGTCTGGGCVAGAYCDVPSGAQIGTCKAEITGEGTLCDSGEACAAPRVCVIPSGMATGTCKTLPAEGAQCDDTQLFACDDLRDYCDPTTTVCTHRAGVGDTCGGTSGVQCVGFATCDPSTSKCVARPGLGDTCDESTGLDCIGELSCVNLTCVAPAAGMTCAL